MNKVGMFPSTETNIWVGSLWSGSSEVWLLRHKCKLHASVHVRHGSSPQPLWLSHSLLAKSNWWTIYLINSCDGLNRSSPIDSRVWVLGPWGVASSNNLFFFFFFFFWDRVSLYRPGCPGTHFVDQAGLKLRNLPASASQVLGLKVSPSTTQPQPTFNKGSISPLAHHPAEVVEEKSC
jgi:hypothetical protein